jgi:cytochrome c-type biogenesis protein CcmF
MHPEKRNYRLLIDADDRGRDRHRPLRATSMSRSANRSTRTSPEGAWAVRVYYKPFVDWIWGGCVLMALGGLLAMLDRRYRVPAPSLPPPVLPGANRMNRYSGS